MIVAEWHGDSRHKGIGREEGWRFQVGLVAPYSLGFLNDIIRHSARFGIIPTADDQSWVESFLILEADTCHLNGTF